MYSLDGMNWLMASGVSYNTNIVSATYCGGILLGAGNGGTGGKGFKYSTDGKTWTASNITTGGAHYAAFAYGNGLYVASGLSKGLFYSTDGMTWTKSNITTGNYCTIYYNGAIWIAGNAAIDKYMYYSKDGKSWTALSSGPHGTGIVEYNSGIWVAYAYNGLWYSVDGIEWIQSNVTSGTQAASGLKLHMKDKWVGGCLEYSVTWEPST